MNKFGLYETPDILCGWIDTPVDEEEVSEDIVPLTIRSCA